MARKLVWNKRPTTFLSAALKHISLESFINAEKVEASILSHLDQCIDNPQRFPKDKFKNNNSGEFRAFETHGFRVAYKFTNAEVRILRIRSVKQEPKEY
ncbi:MAG: type II toxin-antitoxin system RelE/ParE family toxin [Cyclobacteriaceae bacterium]